MLLLSCGEEQIPWELDTSRSPVLVVEGIMTNERKVHQVKISRPMEDPNGEKEMVSGSLVYLFEGENSVRFRER